MNPKEYKQMMEYLTRPSTPLEKKISEEKIKKNKPKQMTLPGMEVPQTQLKPLIDLEKLIEENEDPIVTNRGKQTEALINTTNKHIKDQIKKGNIKKEDLLLKQDSNGLMVNKNKTIAIRDSFMAKQFNRALGVNDEPQATPEQVGKLAERLERNPSRS
jgi:benzoyl-CoA reductase/2-hydroxyglutaryl-CoA dehydratase subunit BcrC/BadD/HgdB